MKVKKENSSILVIGITIVLLLFILVPVFAQDKFKKASGFMEEEEVIGRGRLSDTVTWTVTEDDLGDRTLHIDGTGPIPDFKNSSEQPWKEWNDKIFRLVIGDDVTRIGNNSMGGMLFKEVHIGKGVESIGKHSFAYGRNLEHITIPGNVKRIEANAFVYHYSLYSATFEEGVEEIGHSAFGGQAAKGSVFHIPASVTNIADLACWTVTGYTVDEDNPYYSAMDGVLYDKEKSVLVDYPKYREEAEYRIPDSVCEIRLNALHRIATLKKLYIPSSVQKMQANDLMRWSNIEEVYVDDGVPFPGISSFYGCGKLTTVRLPENIEIKTLRNTFTGNCNSLESLKIPNGVQKVEGLGWPTKALQEIIYDAQNAEILDRQMVDDSICYRLRIGEHVDRLPTEFHWFSSQAEEVIFQGPNQLFIAEDAFSNCVKPVCDMTGNIYVDEQGVCYSYNEDGDARIVYCQEGFESIFIPANIVPEEGRICRVTGVEENAFCKAAGLKTIHFENPEQIQFIKAYGFAHCPSLIQVNGIETIEGVTGLFTGLESEIGYRAFYQTGLINRNEEVDSVEAMGTCSEFTVTEGSVSSMDVSVVSTGGTMQWEAADENGQGRYSLLTGDTITVSANVGNKEGEENFRYRVYFQWSEEDCNLSIKSGNSYVLNEQEVSCHGTEDPRTVYLEFVPRIGKTISIPITAVYPSPSSDGGKLIIWAVILDEETGIETEGRMLFSEAGAIHTVWKTRREEFSVTKTGNGSGNIQLRGDSEGNVLPASDLSWRIVLKRAEDEVSTYGKDYVKRVSYRDMMTLPDGMVWNPEVVSEVKAGRIRRNGNNWYAGQTKICNLAVSGGQLNLSAVRFAWDEETKNMILTYQISNTAKETQMNTNTITYIVYADALRGDKERIHDDEIMQLENTIEAEVYYFHSSEQVLKAKANKTISVTSGTVELSKKTMTIPNYFGEPIQYEVAIRNPGAMPYTADEAGIWVLRDVLSPYSYLSIENMDKMFAEDDTKSMSVTMKNVERKEWTEQTGAYENSVYWQNSSNSGENLSELAQDQLHIGWNKTGTGIQVECDGQIYEQASLRQTLIQAGYASGRWTEHIVEWKLNSEEDRFCMNAGESRIYSVYATAKDTFQMLSKDWPNSYPADDFLTITNTAQLMRQDGSIHKNAGVGNKVKREAYIDKYLYADKTIQQDGFSVDDGTELSYTLKFTHYGKGSYDNLPVIDEMYGAQALLVPEAWNPHLSECNLELYQKGDAAYYILTEGEYSDVRIGGEEDYILIADKITVEKVKQKEEVVDQIIHAGEESPSEQVYEYKGLRTRIEWKFPEFPSGTYSLYLNYQALVIQKLAGENVYTIGNKVWMNDKIDSRISASLCGGGTVIGFDKEILDEKGVTWKKDIINPEDYSLISAGDKITYRLTLENEGPGQYVVSGKDFADQLPYHGNVSPWVKNDNVTFHYESTHASTEIENLEQWEIGTSWNGKEKEGQSYLVWSDDTRIVFSEQNARVYLYVTLTYPGGSGRKNEWSDYCQAVNGNILENTFYVYQFPTNVTHHLNEPGQVLLQKGVYGTSYGSMNQLVETQSRNYYNNRDSRERQIIYYIALFNGGAKNWYLDDIYDELPAGLTCQGLIYDATLKTEGDGTIVQTLSGFDGNQLIDDVQNLAVPIEVSYRNATIRMKEENGKICFEIEPGKKGSSVSYDAKKGTCYLKQNEAIVFGFVCDIGTKTETEDIMTNTSFMKYVDHPSTGVTLVEEKQIKFSGAVNEAHADQNNGECILTTGNIIDELYGLSGVEEKEDWLLSYVSVKRGNIIPGITKYTDSYTTAGSNQLTSYESHVGPQDMIHWRLRLHNSGSLAISNYTIRDILPVPYVFGGTITYTIYDSYGNVMKTYRLLEFSDRNNQSVIITNNNSRKEVSIHGEETSISTSQYGTGALIIEKGEDGSEILTIHFTDSGVSIPEGGYIDIQLSSYNPTTKYKNTVYMNQAELIPNEQTFTEVGQGTMMRDSDEKLYGVKTSSPVTVSFGYGTGSDKGIKEKGNEENTANSMNEKNYIVLNSKENLFTYRLTVTNDTKKAMEKLIFIDRLPEVGDGSPFNEAASRNSEFTVSLAESPNPVVRVIDSDQSVRELSNQEFKVEYSNQTTFSDEDWNGSSFWLENEAGARALRVSVKDDSGTLIPPGAKVEVSFECTVSGDAKPGQMGWNSFGYHYKLIDVEQELEAMPLPVGVKIPEVPTLMKKLEDTKGKPYQAQKEEIFRYIIYEENGNASMEIAIPVPAGQSCSEPMPLDEFLWEEGKTYSIKEVETDSEYRFYKFNELEKEIYTFEYDADQGMLITCVNRIEQAVDFPASGGNGMLVYHMTGVLLCVIASFMYQYFKYHSGFVCVEQKRRKNKRKERNL